MGMNKAPDDLKMLDSEPNNQQCRPLLTKAKKFETVVIGND